MLKISLYHSFRAGDALMLEPRARPASNIFEKSDTEVFQYYPCISSSQPSTATGPSLLTLLGRNVWPMRLLRTIHIGRDSVQPWHLRERPKPRPPQKRVPRQKRLPKVRLSKLQLVAVLVLTCCAGWWWGLEWATLFLNTLRNDWRSFWMI